MKKKDIDTLMHALEETNEFERLIELVIDRRENGFDYIEDIAVQVTVYVNATVWYDEFQQEFVYTMVQSVNTDAIVEEEVESMMKPALDVSVAEPEAYKIIKKVARKIGVAMEKDVALEVFKRILTNLFENGDQYNYGRDLVRG